MLCRFFLPRAILPVLLSAAMVCAQEPPGSPEFFGSIEGVLSVVPPALNLRTGREWNVVDVEKANQAVKAHADQRRAQFEFKVAVFEPFQEHGWGYRMMATDGRVSTRGAVIGYRLWVYFRPEQAQTLAGIHKGSKVIVSGKLNRADIQMYDGRPVLSLDLWEAKIVK